MYSQAPQTTEYIVRQCPPSLLELYYEKPFGVASGREKMAESIVASLGSLGYRDIGVEVCLSGRNHQRRYVRPRTLCWGKIFKN